MIKRGLWLAALLATPVLAETMTVDAARLDVNQQAGTAVFSGNVVVNRPDLDLTSNKLTAVLAANGNDIEKLVAVGNVRITRMADGVKETATGDEATYFPARSKLVMTGAVKLTHGANTLVGNRLEYDIKAGKANLTSSGRVRANFGE